jgi:enoyl-CoA hydratase/carnithine racemase
MLDVITEAIDLAAGDDDVRCVVFIGEGRAFWAGA